MLSVGVIPLKPNHVPLIVTTLQPSNPLMIQIPIVCNGTTFSSVETKGPYIPAVYPTHTLETPRNPPNLKTSETRKRGGSIILSGVTWCGCSQEAAKGIFLNSLKNLKPRTPRKEPLNLPKAHKPLKEMKEEWDELATYTPYFLVWGLQTQLSSLGTALPL